jgi:hypothetical protein
MQVTRLPLSVRQWSKTKNISEKSERSQEESLEKIMQQKQKAHALATFIPHFLEFLKMQMGQSSRPPKQNIAKRQNIAVPPEAPPSASNSASHTMYSLPELGSSVG